jgi:hypothetical protein
MTTDDHARPGLADPAHVLRACPVYPPGVRTYWLARRSVVGRFVRDAKEAGATEVTDLGPLPLAVNRADALLIIGVRRGGAWESITPGMEQVARAAADLERGRN